MKHPEDSLMAKEIYMATFKKSAYEKETGIQIVEFFKEQKIEPIHMPG